MVGKLHRATDEAGDVTYVVELLNDEHAGAQTTIWLGPKCERLKHAGNELLVEVSGQRYRLCELLAGGE